MPKKNKRRDRNSVPDEQPLHEKLEQIAQDAAMHFPAPQEPPQSPDHPAPNPAWPNLAQMRNRALDLRADTQRTILELEGWRDEIEATLAFLRAGRR